MVSPQWDERDEAQKALRAIVSDPAYGVAALSSAQIMANLLKDLLPDAPREVSVLVAAAEAGVAGNLRDRVSQGMDVGTASAVVAGSFAASTPFRPDACSWAVSEIAGALGLSSPASGAPPGSSIPPGSSVPGGSQPTISAPLGAAGPRAAPDGYPPAAGEGGYPAAAGAGGYPAAASPGGYPAGAVPSGYPPGAAPGGYPPGSRPAVSRRPARSRRRFLTRLLLRRSVSPRAAIRAPAVTRPRPFPDTGRRPRHQASFRSPGQTAWP